MAGLSSNVMNMKFMQKADNRNPTTQEPLAVKKVRDSSEWFLPNRQELRKKLHPTVKVSTMGYGSIANLRSEKEQELANEKEQADKLQDEVAESSPATEADKKKDVDDFLLSIMNKPAKKRKSKESLSGSSSNKKKKHKK